MVKMFVRKTYEFTDIDIDKDLDVILEILNENDNEDRPFKLGLFNGLETKATETAEFYFCEYSKDKDYIDFYKVNNEAFVCAFSLKTENIDSITFASKSKVLKIWIKK
jgi:hypothetical protein